MGDGTTGSHPLDADDYDWKEAFALAGEPGGENSPQLQPCAPGIEVSSEPFARADVEYIEAYEEGENDGPDWICLGRVKDGRWFFLRAGCDYTGWDCRSGGLVDLAPDRETLIRYGITNRELARLGLPENDVPVNGAEHGSW